MSDCCGSDKKGKKLQEKTKSVKVKKQKKSFFGRLLKK